MNRFCRRLGGISLALALLPGSGCDHQRRAAQDEPRLHSSRAPVQPPADLSVAAARFLPPLRRTPQSIDLWPEFSPCAGAPAAPAAPVAFSGARNEDGNVTLRAVVLEPEQSAASVEALVLLKSLGFQANDTGATNIWTRRLKPVERADFEKSTVAAIQSESKELETRWRSYLSGRHPGHPTVVHGEHGTRLAGRLVYTGNPLDIAMADSGGEGGEEAPHAWLFLAVDGVAPAYLRGGRMYVGADRNLFIDGHSLAPRIAPVPRDALQVRVDSSGEVSALGPAAEPVKLGTLSVVGISDMEAEPGGGFRPRNQMPEAVALKPVFLPGHLEFSPEASSGDQLEALARAGAWLRALEQLLAVLNPPPRLGSLAGIPSHPGASGSARAEPIVIHADVPWSAEHLKALGIELERTPARTIIAAENDPEALAVALVKVLTVLRTRMGIHEQNLRNAERIRDAENRINPYRRKTIKIGPQGEAIEGLDASPFPKTFKPGDPNANAEGFVLLPNVNRTVESAEFQAAIDEYKLMRAVLERISPNQIFPDPPTIPAAPNGQ